MDAQLLDVVFGALGELLLTHAFQLTINSRRESSSLAKLVVGHPGFANLDKERLLTDESYFRDMLDNVRLVYRDALSKLNGLLESPGGVHQVHSALVNHPLLAPPMQLTKSSERHNFLVLGHPRAGKTCLIQRMLYGLTQNPDIGVFGSDTETTNLASRVERFANYQAHFSELAENNERLDNGQLFHSTGAKNDNFVDIEYYSTGYIVRLKFFDYSGFKMQSITDLAQLTDYKHVDGIIVLMDSYRLLSEELLESAHRQKLIDRDAHAKKYGHILQKSFTQRADLTTGLLQRIQYLKHHKIPIVIVFTKFDGFQHFGQSEEAAKQMIYAKVHSMLHGLINMRRHPIAACFTSAFGGSELERDANGELLIEDQYTALPVLRPNAKFTLRQYIKAQGPLMFLVRSIMQDKVGGMSSFFEQRRRELGLVDKFLYRRKLDSIGGILREERNRWQVSGPEGEDLAVIPPDLGPSDARRHLEEFFGAGEARH